MDYESYFEYLPKYIEPQKGKEYFRDIMKQVDWVSHSYQFYGREVKMPRMVKWYSKNSYDYSGLHNEPCEMIEVVKDIMKELDNHNLNSCLLNLYRDGSDSIAKHKDDEKSMDSNESIYVISLGTTRKFTIRSDDKTYKKTINVEHGSLFIMKKGFQEHFTHEIPKQNKILTPRISLTFRKSI